MQRTALRAAADAGRYAPKGRLSDGGFATPGHTLDIRITQVHAPGGGKWSGPKVLRAEGTLYVDGQVAGSFIAKRKTRLGKHTCAMLHNNAEAMAEDIADWLEKPTLDARLGDAD